MVGKLPPWLEQQIAAETPCDLWEWNSTWIKNFSRPYQPKIKLSRVIFYSTEDDSLTTFDLLFSFKTTVAIVLKWKHYIK